MEFSLERGMTTLFFVVTFVVLIAAVYPFSNTSVSRVEQHTAQTMSAKDTSKNTVTEINQETIDNFDINSIPVAN